MSAEKPTVSDTRQQPVLRVEGLLTHLGPQDNPLRVVDDVSFDIYRGETLALLGESGCGKSMTAFSLMRLLPPGGRIRRGRVVLNGSNLLHLNESEMRSVRGGRMGMIFQEPMTSLNPVMTVGEQIAEAVHLHDDLARSEVRSRVIELLKDVGIPAPQQRIDDYPHQMSGGMKQRVMIAMALAGKPDLLIADEPTTALDVTIQLQVLQLMKKLQREHGMAIMLITHDLGVVSQVADRLAVMYAGHLVETADTRDFFVQPAHPYSRKLLQALPLAQRRQKNLSIIKGQVSSLQQHFTRCRFEPRCDQSIAACARVLPDWTELSGGHKVRCLLWQPEYHLKTSQSKQNEPQQAIESARSDAGEVVLIANNLKVYFPVRKGLFKRVVAHVKAVDGVSLELRRGRTTALVGESGSGKTTVGKAILQLQKATAGQVRFGTTELTGLPAADMRRLRKHLQIIFQDPLSAMNPRMLVQDIVAEGLRAQKLFKSHKEVYEQVRKRLQQVGLSADSMTRYPHEFSGGQRQRICIARALAVEPQLIICDEPTSALDVSVQAQILNLLKGLQRQMNLSYLFITHDLSVVSWLADEVAVMYLGRIVELGRVEQIMSQPRHPYTQVLLSAIPEIDSSRAGAQASNDGDRRKSIRLEGDIPSPIDAPSGCHFHPRCPKALPVCREQYPSPVPMGERGYVCCVLYAEQS
ncbi:MAG: ABC transporter ATP-binding protein [gamma proteobacterium symbiont of Bathyaustriella thionipta]|nr:ABC transporter ATP-binding protein [gamma proteobacterium symbiont of Bathyaustriella thionipta]